VHLVFLAERLAAVGAADALGHRLDANLFDNAFLFGTHISMDYQRIIEVLPNNRFVERVRQLEAQGAFAATIKVLKHNMGYELTMLVPIKTAAQVEQAVLPI
jgi:hypothetical protein